MKIILTNDDGIDAEGIKALATELRKKHDVWVIAPDRERSGASHSVNLRDPGRIMERADREYSCSGSPADCVMLAYLGFLDFRPDIVVSGINRGPNLGTDILYSGTCAAARQAALYAIPGIAVSCASRHGPFLYAAAADFVARNLEALAGHCSENAFINVNAPSSDELNLEGRWTEPSRRHYHDSVRPFKAPDGGVYCFVESGPTETIGGESSDESVVGKGLVAVSSILVHPQISAEMQPGKAFSSR
jgi:5'-nucleotidase